MGGNTDLTTRQGVEAVRSLLVELGWYPREPSDPDHGIDLLVETAINGVANGRMFALQVKSGKSQFSERTETYAVHRCSDRHVRYWLGHSLPVLVVLYEPEDKVAYWQMVRDETVRSTGDRWKIEVPFSQQLAVECEGLLRELARASPEALTVDWANVLQRGPLALLDGGEQRYAEALALRAEEPRRAAEVLLELSGQLDDHHTDVAGNLEAASDWLRGEAARLAAQGGDIEMACSALIEVVRRCVECASQPINFHIETLRGWLSTERWWIANSWRVCLDWPEDLQTAIDTLTVALEGPRDPLVSSEDRRLWQEHLVELLLIDGDSVAALRQIESLPPLDGESSDPLVRLQALRAEALDSLQRVDEADMIWDRVSHWADKYLRDRLPLHATLVARRGVALARRGCLQRAQEAFADAALLWGQVAGAEDEVAEQYFSAQSAESLVGDPWSSPHSDRRAVAVALRGQGQTPDAIAERLELRGLNARVIGRGFDALNRFSLALLEHRRAGHFRGELYATQLLTELYEHAGEYGAALDAAIQGGRVADAERLAVYVSPSELLQALQCDEPIWTRQPRLAALAAGGRRLDALQMAGLADWVLLEARRPIESMRDRDLVFAAHSALAATIFTWPSESADQALALLEEDLSSGNLLLAEPAATALQLLTNAGIGDYTDALTVAFLESRHARVSAWFVSSHLHDHASARCRVLAAAGEGRLDALEVCATAEVDCPGTEVLDAAARKALNEQLRSLLERRIGHNEEGHFIGGLRLEPWGLFACVSEDAELREQVAEKLLEFAIDDREPHSSRASAVNAIFNLSGGLDAAIALRFADRLRVIAEGQFQGSIWDEPREVIEHSFNRNSFWENASADRLRAAAVLACAALTACLQERPQWPTDLLENALFSAEAAVVVGALEAIARFDEIALPSELASALVHPDARVRRAALAAWRRRHDVPALAILQRLLTDADVGVRLTLLGLLRDGDREPQLRAQIARDDPDAYVRAMACAPLPALSR
ncbi:MAG TPA: DUF4365 domain-containing protein [Solirubrobacteraceae bacterium]